MDAAIAAIASPARRRMLTLVRDRERSSSELADATGMTRPATSQHLRVLRNAGLVSVRRDGGRRFYRADDRGVDELRRYLDDFWRGRLGALKHEAERRHRRNK